MGRAKKQKLSIVKCIIAIFIGIFIIYGGARLFNCAWDAFVHKTPDAPLPSQPQVVEPKPAPRTETPPAPPAAKVEKPLSDKVPPAVDGTNTYSVLIDKSEHKVYLLDNDKKVAVWGCSIGLGGAGQKQKEGDNMTPTGTFVVDEIDDASAWTHDFGDGKGAIAGAYGPFFISLDTERLSKGQWDGIGIHGTHDPASIGTNASEGCVRLDNANLRKLIKYVKVGTKVTITE